MNGLVRINVLFALSGQSN